MQRRQIITGEYEPTEEETTLDFDEDEEDEDEPMADAGGASKVIVIFTSGYCKCSFPAVSGLSFDVNFLWSWNISLPQLWYINIHLSFH